MFDANVKLIEELKEFVSVVSTEPEFLNHFRFSERDFIRTRKLPFDRLVFLIAGLCKKTLSVENGKVDFFKNLTRKAKPEKQLVNSLL